MTERDATEIAYKNGYKKGKADATRAIFKDLKEHVKPITKVVKDGEVIYESQMSLEELENKYTEEGQA